MQEHMVPCRNPRLCKVKDHKAGTVAECQKEGARTFRNPAFANVPSMVPKLGSDRTTNNNRWSSEIQDIAEINNWSPETRNRDIRMADNGYLEPELYEVVTANNIKAGDSVLIALPTQSYGEAIGRVVHSGPDSVGYSQINKLRWHVAAADGEDDALILQRMDREGKSWPFKPEVKSTLGMKLMRAVDSETGEPVNTEVRPELRAEVQLDIEAARESINPEFKLKSRAAAAMSRAKIGINIDALATIDEIDPGVFAVSDQGGRKFVIFDNAAVTTKTKATGYLYKDANPDAAFEFTGSMYKDEGSTTVQPESAYGDFGDGHRWGTPFIPQTARDAAKAKYREYLI